MREKFFKIVPRITIDPADQTTISMTGDLHELTGISGAALSYDLGKFDYGTYRGVLSALGAGLGKNKRIGACGKGFLFVRWLSMLPVAGSALNFFFGYLFPEAAYITNVFGSVCFGYLLIVALISTFSLTNTKMAAFFLEIPVIQSLKHTLNFVMQTKEVPRFLHLSDGGHTENLAALPLFYHLERYHTIYIADMGHDEYEECSDLVYLIDTVKRHIPNIKISGTNDEDFYDSFWNFKNSGAFFLTFKAAMGDNEATVVYFKPRRMSLYDLSHELYANIDSLNGCCCECCHKECCCGCQICFGKYPWHSTGQQFYSPKMFKAYHELGLQIVNRKFLQEHNNQAQNAVL